MIRSRLNRVSARQPAQRTPSITGLDITTIIKSLGNNRRDRRLLPSVSVFRNVYCSVDGSTEDLEREACITVWQGTGQFNERGKLS